MKAPLKDGPALTAGVCPQSPQALGSGSGLLWKAASSRGMICAGYWVEVCSADFLDGCVGRDSVIVRMKQLTCKCGAIYEVTENEVPFRGPERLRAQFSCALKMRPERASQT